ncbi:hypothetical protein PINS_up010239 [Pythium insidiosum]|nr:hypothetical protein PINS_up010239 [Pythium insidiosum]
MIGNFLMKILIQSVSKHVLLRNNVKNIRTMFLTVGVPTVLIDTQLRVVLQRAYSSKLTVAGTIVMAAIEIIARISKAVMSSRHIRQLERREKNHRAIADANNNGDLNSKIGDSRRHIAKL